MKIYYEKPEADIISFRAQEQLAVINGEIEDEINDNEANWKSKDF